MNKRIFGIFAIIGFIFLYFLFQFISLVFKPNIVPSDFDYIDQYNQMNLAINILFGIIIPFGFPFLIILIITLIYIRKNKVII